MTKSNYKILFLCDFFNRTSGASAVFPQHYKSLPFVSEDSLLLVKEVMEPHPDLEIQNHIRIANGAQAVDEYVSGEYDIVHWFKSASNILFDEFVTEMKKRRIRRVPIVTHVLQNPSYRGNFVTINELKFSAKFVFIDKTSYNNKRYAFIPKESKAMIYCNYRTPSDIEAFDNIYKDVKKEPCDAIVFGRGSSLVKCPHDMFERVFDKIDNPKKFVIVGGKGGTWIEEKINERRGLYEVEWVQHLPYEEWIKKIVQFDVFLYYLPDDAFSSIDGTLGQAMLQGKPVVYYGPGAPAERFHDANALVAKTPDELPELCNRLAKDPELRRRIGTKGRETTIKDFSIKPTLKNFKRVYDEVYEIPSPAGFSIPVSFLIWQFLNQPKVRVFRIGVGKILHGDFSPIVNHLCRFWGRKK